jgi:DNA-binding transcriptional ArsR family regulator
MVENRPGLDDVFHALSDSTRRSMLRRLGGGELTVGELAQPFSMSLAAASKHIKTLERAGLISRTVKGRVHFCRLEPGPLGAADAWLRRYQRYWIERLDTLETLLNEEEAS